MIKTLKHNLRKLCDSDNLPFVVLAVIMFVLHSFCDWNTGDFVKMTTHIAEQGLFEHLYLFLSGWASGAVLIIIEFILINIPIGFWMISDTLVIIIMAVCFQKLLLVFSPNSNLKMLNWAIVVSFMLYPIYDMITAGWVITTIAYVFTLAFAALALVPLIKIYGGEKISPIFYVIYFIANTIGSNSLQAVFLIVGLYTRCIAERFLAKQKVHAFFVVQWFGSALWLIWHVVSPANILRYIWEMHRWPDLQMYSIVQKIKLSTAATTSNFIQDPNAVFIAFSILLLLCIWRKYSDSFYRFLSTIPLFFALISIVGPIAVYHMFPMLESSMTFMGNATNSVTAPDLVIPLTQSRGITAYLPLMSQFFVFALIAVLLYLIFGNTKITLLVISIYLVGIITRMVMTVSPTLYISEKRTFIYMYATLIFIGLVLFIEYMALRYNTRKEDAAI
jgi:hypothetical protein